MEKIKLAEGGIMPQDQIVLCGDDSREEILPAAKYFEAMQLDLMLLELENQVGLMDGIPVLEVAANE